MSSLPRVRLRGRLLLDQTVLSNAALTTVDRRTYSTTTSYSSFLDMNQLLRTHATNGWSNVFMAKYPGMCYSGTVCDEGMLHLGVITFF